MKRKINQLCLFMLLGAALFSTTSCSERVDAGSEGILVNLYGSDKGVDDVSLVTGRVWYNPFTEEVYEYPTYVQTIDFRHSPSMPRMAQNSPWILRSLSKWWMVMRQRYSRSTARS